MSQEGDTSTTSTKRSLVFVDDEVELLEIFAERYEREFAVSCFKSPQELLTAVEQGLRPEAIVTDMRMGQMNGIEMMRALCEKGFQFPAVLMSGDASKELIEEALKTSIRHVLEKPCRDAELTQWIKRLMTEVPAQKVTASRTDSPTSTHHSSSIEKNNG